MTTLHWHWLSLWMLLILLLLQVSSLVTNMLHWLRHEWETVVLLLVLLLHRHGLSMLRMRLTLG
jgi:hypothetical protein